MILDSLEHHALYHHLGPRFARGFAWFTGVSVNLPDGRYEIDGQDVYALVQSYQTVPATEKKYEAHRHYADIQYVAEGTEVIHYAPLPSLRPVTDYNPEKDYQLYADPEQATALFLSPGQFAVFHPQDGHKPGCLAGVSYPIKKVVIKVRL